MKINKLLKANSTLTDEERSLLLSLNTPSKIQDYINSLKFHFKSNSKYLTPQEVIKKGKADCLEGALLASLALWVQGYNPMLMDLKTATRDIDHVVALFKQGGKWGAISKTNHAVLRYREPIYKTPRELAVSYFHEYFLNDGTKTLRSFSKPFDLAKFGFSWVSKGAEVQNIVTLLDHSEHEEILTNKEARFLRKADPIERRAGKIKEHKR